MKNKPFSGKDEGRYLVGGISSAGREIPLLDERKLFAERSKGPYIWDEKGARYIDLIMGYGTSVLGHSPEGVAVAVGKKLQEGFSPGLNHRLEEEAAALLAHVTLPQGKVVFLNSGSEAIHLACRAARSYTGKNRIIRFYGAYHGWIEVAEGEMTSQLEFNSIDDLKRVFEACNDIAAILVEPILANTGCICPTPVFLSELERLARANDSLIIADEVLMGFRVHCGLTSHKLGLDPDIAVVGKVIGSGIPVSAVVGRESIMRELESTRIGRFGTFNGNPLATAAVKATLKELGNVNYNEMIDNGNRLRHTLEKSGARNDMPLCTSGYGSIFSVWFNEQSPENYKQAKEVRHAGLSEQLHIEMRKRGVLIMPGSFGRVFFTATHTDSISEELAGIFEEAIAVLAGY